jgi:DNA-binding response OmpR family regulator
MSDRPVILLVEDEPLSQDVLSRRLVAQGYTVEVVSDGMACLEWLDDHRCDLILMDIAMPRLDGMETLRQVRRSYSHDSLPVIIISAMVDSEDVVTGLTAGANDYVVKPINFRVLQARIHACLRMKRTVTMLVEAERQRVMIETLSQSASRLAEPLAQTIDHLERAMNRTLADQDTQEHLHEVVTWVEDVVKVLEQLKAAGEHKEMPYTQRLELLRDEPT